MVEVVSSRPDDVIIEKNNEVGRDAGAEDDSVNFLMQTISTKYKYLNVSKGGKTASAEGRHSALLSPEKEHTPVSKLEESKGFKNSTNDNTLKKKPENEICNEETTTVAPPPPQETLARSNYLDNDTATPGAFHVNGLLTTNTDPIHTVNRSHEQQQTNSPERPSDTALLTATRVDEDGGIIAVAADPMKPKPRYCCSVKNRCLASTLLLLSLAAVALVTSLLLVLRDQSDPKGLPLESQSPNPPPTSFNDFDPPTIDDCLSIEAGRAVDGQNDNMIPRTFDVDLEVALAPDANIFPLLSTLKEIMQRELSPALAECEGTRRYLRRTAEIIPSYVVANAGFATVTPRNEACEDGAQNTCYRLTASLQLHLKRDQKTSKLIAHILDVTDRSAVALGLQAPFQSFNIIGVATTDQTDSVGLLPTFPPSADSNQDVPSTESLDED